MCVCVCVVKHGTAHGTAHGTCNQCTLVTLLDSWSVLVGSKHADGDVFIHRLFTTLHKTTLRLSVTSHTATFSNRQTDVQTHVATNNTTAGDVNVVLTSIVCSRPCNCSNDNNFKQWQHCLTSANRRSQLMHSNNVTYSRKQTQNGQYIKCRGQVI